MNDHGLRYLEDYAPGTTCECGRVSVDEASISTFAKGFDRQPGHVDPVAAASGPFGGHVTSQKGARMLYAFGFERVGVLVGDLYSVDPRPRPGQEGAERGVRLGLRVLARGAPKGSIYSAQPIEVGPPIWRADFLETVAGPPGSYDRTGWL